MVRRFEWRANEDVEVLDAGSGELLVDYEEMIMEDVHEFYDPSQPRAPRGMREGGKWISGRVPRALASHVPATAERQAQAAKYEETVAKLIGGKNLDDHEPFDVIKGRHAVEVKCLVSGKNLKVTMHPDSLMRKANFLRDEKMTGHTVVIDARGDRPVYYYKVGVGSFRLSNMQQVKGAELKGLIGGQGRYAEFDPDAHPRQPAGSDKGGEFAPKGGNLLPPTFTAKMVVLDGDTDVVQKHLSHLRVIPKEHLAVVSEFAGEICIGNRPVTEQDDLGHLKGVRPRGWPEGYTWDSVAGCGPAWKGGGLVLGSGHSGAQSIAWHELAHALDYGVGARQGDNLSKRIDFDPVYNIMRKLHPYFIYREEAFAGGYELWMAGRTGLTLAGAKGNKAIGHSTAYGTFTKEIKDVIDNYYGKLKVA